MVEITLVIDRLPVLFRQRDYGFFPSWMYVMNATLLELPLGLIDTFLWSIVVYWLVGMTASAGQYDGASCLHYQHTINRSRFFLFWAILYAVYQACSMLSAVWVTTTLLHR